MARFVVRVELYTSDEGDYDALRDAMRARGFAFARRLPGALAGGRFHPPAAEYVVECDLGGDRVMDGAHAAAGEAGPFYTILVSETSETARVHEAPADTDSHRSLPTEEKPAIR